MALARVFLAGADVDQQFRDELFDAANRSGMALGEFALTAVAEKMARSGRTFPGIFRKGERVVAFVAEGASRRGRPAGSV